MAKKPACASDGSRAGINDDIGEEMRLTIYRLQIEIRESEQRAFDLFLQNLVKGTSHLSLGQEAVAAGFAAAMKPGTSRSAPIAATPTRSRAACRSRRCWAS
jgi:acetoin:2,6-dichlorophenolindophenol oxidoreductase subunit alpha